MIDELTLKNREPLSSLVLYRFAKWSILSPMLNIYFRGRVYGIENIPQSGSYIVVCNHASNLDPPILGISTCRPVSFMAKEELFHVPVLKNLIYLYGAYPVKRTAGDRAAIKSAIKFLNQGWLVGIFLEGTRTNDGKVNEPKLGAALIAAKTQTPIIPASIWGTEKNNASSNLIFPTPITIRFGEIIPPPQSKKKEDLQAYTDGLAEIINQMHALGR
ncbi:MAG: lysophospholipid acyltransferase family protein [Pleurocapsa sp.]